MQRERVSDNVYWFQSEVYAQVTAGAITGPQWAVVIDTLAMPEETIEMRSYIEEQLGVPVRYVINTHYHADHCWGNCFFPGATVIAHKLWCFRI
jgi:glyoxylase-like metal-dependent hydrolase (beta-lactamase superfamily II)